MGFSSTGLMEGWGRHLFIITIDNKYVSSHAYVPRIVPCILTIRTSKGGRRHTEEKRCKSPRVATGGCERQRHLGIEWIYALMGDNVRLHWHQYALHVAFEMFLSGGRSRPVFGDVIFSALSFLSATNRFSAPLPSQYRILIDRPLSAVCQENSRRASIDN